MPVVIDKETIQRFDTPGPRYTSYPTAPVWNARVSDADYWLKLAQFGQSEKTLSLYVHVPFCQSMCTYCACSVVIRKHEDKYGDEYVDYLIREIDLVAAAIGCKKMIKQFHWGGGTPTFLNPAQIKRLFDHIAGKFTLDYSGEVAIEIDPRTIDQEKLSFLQEIGFNRISLGVQDFSEDVQKSINRVQPYELVADVYRACRRLGFTSINFDLIYGLPKQTLASFRETIEKVVALRPDRIALYSFAYVPWLKKHQQKIDEKTLPSNDEKLGIFLESRDIFLKAGYEAIAMDHFALKSDELAKAFAQGQLHRNFMGYTVKPADEYVGIGMTSIGFLENTFFQNEKTLPAYYKKLDQGKLPIERGKVLTRDDQIRQWSIKSLMCQFQLDKEMFQRRFGVSFNQYFHAEMAGILQCGRDGLIKVTDERINVTELGKIFIRNVCMHFDAYLKQPTLPQRFSRTV